jgi:hypothetical protein
MEKETKISSKELHKLAVGLAGTFIQRWDMYPRQLDTGAYLCVKKPLTMNHIIAHLQGKITLGAYLLDANSQARFIVIDADDKDQFEQTASMATSLRCHGLISYLERSRRGGTPVVVL